MLHLVICCSTGKKTDILDFGEQGVQRSVGRLSDCLLEIVEKRLDKF